MALSNELEAMAPRTSWWCQPTREAFKAAMAPEMERMKLVPKTSLVMLDGNGKRSRPSTRKTEGDE